MRGLPGKRPWEAPLCTMGRSLLPGMFCPGCCHSRRCYFDVCHVPRCCIPKWQWLLSAGSCHTSEMVQEWFEDHNQLKVLALSPNYPHLHPIKIQPGFKSHLGAGHHSAPLEVLWRLNESEPFCLLCRDCESLSFLIIIIILLCRGCFFVLMAVKK